MILLALIFAVLGGFLVCVIGIVIPLWEEKRKEHYKRRELERNMRYAFNEILYILDKELL